MPLRDEAANKGDTVMDDKFTRRNLLRTLVGGAITSAGIVTLARSSLASVPETPAVAPTDLDVQARAAGLEGSELVGQAGEAHAQFLNFPGAGVGFGNGGGFRNGGFRNGGFFNGGGFRNGGFRNGGFGNGGGFRNGGFRNGGGGGFRNAFRNR
jgi:hypothetical protein